MSLLDAIAKPISSGQAPEPASPRPLLSAFAMPSLASKTSPLEFVSKPVSSIVDRVKSIASKYDDSQLQSGIGDANHWKADVSKDFPFSDSAKDLINKRVNYTYNRDLGANKDVAGRTGTDNPSQYEVQVGKDSTSDTAKYETFHALFAHSKIDPVDFNAAWEKAKRGPDNLNNEIGSFDDHFSQYPRTFKSQGGPIGAENVDNDPYSLATERFASLGLAYGSEGISAIPKDLQPFYREYIGEKLGTIPNKGSDGSAMMPPVSSTTAKSTAPVAPNAVGIDPFGLTPGLGALAESVHEGSVHPAVQYLKQKFADLSGNHIDEKGNIVEGTMSERLRAAENLTMALGITGEGKTVSAENALKIARSSDEKAISGLLQREVPKLTPDQSAQFAKVFKHINNPEDVTTAINRIRSEIDAAPKNPDNMEKISTSKKSDVPNGLKPLAEEAKKYKSAEDFVNTIKDDVNARPSADSRFVYHVSETPNIESMSPQPGRNKGVYFTPGEPSRSNGYVYAVDRSKLPPNFFEADPSGGLGDIRTQNTIPKEAVIPLGKITAGRFNKIQAFTDFYNKAVESAQKTTLVPSPASRTPKMTTAQFDRAKANAYLDQRIESRKASETIPQTASDIVGDGSNLNAIEANVAKYVEANKESLKSDYRAKFGNVFNVDNMKELIPGHAENRTISEAFHKPAANLIGEMVDKAIDENKGTGKKVVLFAGAPAAGKTSAVEGLSTHDEYLAHAGVVIDGTLADNNRSSDIIKKALGTNQSVQIIYVENTPDRIMNNAISRAQSGGRTVPIETIYNALQKSRQNIHRIAGKFGDTGRLKISVIDNSHEVPRIVDNGVGFIRNKVYSAGDIQRFKEAAYHKVITLHNEGEITKKSLDGFIRRKLQGSEGSGVGSRPVKFTGEESDAEIRKKQKTGEQQSSKGSILESKIDEVKTQLEIARDALRAHPAKGLVKYANFKTGQLPEVLGGEGGKFKKRGDQVVTELGFKDSEEARRSYEDYLGRRTKFVVLEQQYRALRDLERSEKLHQDAIDSAKRFLEQSNGEMGKGVEVAAKAKLRQRLSEMAGEAEKRRVRAHANLRSLEQVLEKEAPALDLETLSIEAQALQLSSVEYSQLPSLQSMLVDTPTSVKQKVGILDYLRTPDRVLKKIGLGKNAEEIRAAYENYLSELPQHINLLREWTDRVLKHPGSDTKVFQYLDGELKKTWDPETKSMRYDMTPEEYLVAEEIRAYLKEWSDRLNLPEDGRIARYITHIFEDQIIKKEFDEDLAKIIDNKVPGSVYDQFLEKRLGMKGYVQSTRRALEAYIKRAVRKVNMDPALEHLKTAVGGDLKYAEGSRIELSQFKYVKRYVDHINIRPGEIETLIDNTTKQLLGYRFGQRPVIRAMKATRMMVYRGMLGLNFGSAIRNLTQGVNTYAKLGEKYTIIGYTKLFTNTGSRELLDNGIFGQDLIQDKALSASRRNLQKIDKVLFVFFEMAEKINRGAAYWGAKSKYIAEHTRKYTDGVSIMPETLERDAIEYAKKMVRDTQFSFGTIDTPAILRSEIVKTLLQFGSYSIKQAEFLTEMATKREWAGLIRYALASTLVVYSIGKIFNIKADNFIPMNFFLKFGAPPTLQLPLTIIQALLPNQVDKYGKPVSMGQKFSNIGQAFIPLIPAGIQAQKTIQGIQAYRKDSAVKSPFNAARAAAIGKTNLPQQQKVNDILKKYGVGKNQNAANALFKKYGIK